MQLKLNNHWMSVIIDEKIFEIETIFYGTKTVVLKDAEKNIITKSFDEIDNLTITTF